MNYKYLSKVLISDLTDKFQTKGISSLRSWEHDYNDESYGFRMIFEFSETFRPSNYVDIYVENNHMISCYAFRTAKIDIKWIRININDANSMDDLINFITTVTSLKQC